MKIRYGFVSNSSSTSFRALGDFLIALEKENPDLFKQFNDMVSGVVKEACKSLGIFYKQCPKCEEMMSPTYMLDGEGSYFECVCGHKEKM